MTEVSTLVRRDSANRDVAGKTFIVAGGLQFDGPNQRIKVGDDITLDGSTTRITVGTGSTTIVLDGENGLIEVGSASDITLDSGNKRMVLKDSDSVNRVLIDAANGVIKVSESGTNVLTASNSDLTFLSTYRQLRESTIHTSGGNTFTNTAPYSSIDDFLTKIDFSDWDDMEWYFEASFKAGTGTASVRLYNVTDAGAVTSSVVQTTSTTYVSVRSSALTKLSGTKTFVVQYGHTPSGGGSDFINLTICRHIFRRPA